MKYEQEKQRATHLLILIVYTITTFGLIGESLLLGWEMGAVVLIIIGLILSWGIHITGKISGPIRLWLYFGLTMLTFFFYGIHETSIYDMAPLMILVIIMYSAAENYHIIRLCVATYVLTMLYDFVFVLGEDIDFSPLALTRTILHLVLVFMAGKIIGIEMERRGRERKNADSLIAELEEINRRTEDFLANVSHELRTPINVVTGITTTTLKSEENAEKKANLLAVQEAGYRLFHQIEDILDYTEIDTGRIQISKEAYMISSLVNDFVTENRLINREDAPELILDINAGMPSVLLGDGRKIKKIIKHLVGNAMKFTPKGGVYVRIDTMKKPYGVNLCIQVSDTGIGIEEENLKRMTERFYQSENGRNRRAGGLGLGLSIVQGMVAAMEGFMQIESTPGNGTTVTLSIPQEVVEETPSVAVEKREHLCLACFLKPEKYEVPEVRDYYNKLISNMARELELSLFRADRMEKLKTILDSYHVTHLFIGREEYLEHQTYFEEIAVNMELIVAVDGQFSLPKDSRAKLLRKPFYCLAVANILKTRTEDENPCLEEYRMMICPGIRVLVVDDEPMNLLVAGEILKDYQMEVSVAESGKRAIELCETEEYDVIFLDHMMPEMDGVETLKILRKMHMDDSRELTIIAFTANAVSGAREMFLEEGFDEFISKPIELLELERVLRKMLPKSAYSYVDKYDQKEREDEKNKEDKFTGLRRAGVKIQSGMQYCKGDVLFYEELLQRFADEAAGKERELQAFINQEDWGNYQIRIHAIKSTSKMLGADRLSALARQLEEAAKNADADYIKEHHEEFLTEYHEVVELIQKMSDTGEDAGEIIKKNCTEISVDELLHGLKELRESLCTFEIDKVEAHISKWNGMAYQGVMMEEFLSTIYQNIEEFELAKAAEEVMNLINSIEGGEEA